MFKQCFYLLACVVGLTPAVWGHVYSYGLVEVTLKVEPGQIRAAFVIHDAANVWKEQILRVDSFPGTRWPERAVQRADAYLAHHFRLYADETKLTGRLTGWGYREEAWDIGKGRFHFERRYTLPDRANRLSGKSLFYKETYQEVVDQGHTDEIPQFVSAIHIAGRPALQVDRTPGDPEFSFAMDEIMRSAGAIQRDAFWSSFKRLIMFLPFALYVFGLAFVAPAFSRVWWGLGLSALSVTAFLLPPPPFASHANFWAYLAVIVAGGLNLMPVQRAWWLAAQAAGAVLFGLDMRLAESWEAFASLPVAGLPVAFASALVVAIPIGFSLCYGLRRLYEKTLRTESEALAPHTFKTHQRTLGILLILLAVIQITRGWNG